MKIQRLKPKELLELNCNMLLKVQMLQGKLGIYLQQYIPYTKESLQEFISENGDSFIFLVSIIERENQPNLAHIQEIIDII